MDGPLRSEATARGWRIGPQPAIARTTTTTTTTITKTTTSAKRTQLREDNRLRDDDEFTEDDAESLHNQRRGTRPGLVAFAGAGGFPTSTPFFRLEAAGTAMAGTTGEWIDALRGVRTAAALQALLDGTTTHHGLAWGPAQVQAGPAGPLALQVRWDEPVGAVPLAGRYLAPLPAMMRHVAGVGLHTVWDAAEYHDPGHGGEFYAATAEFVACRALRLGVRLPGAGPFLVVFATEPALLADRTQVLPLIAQLQVFALHLEELGRALLHSPYQLSPLTSPLEAAEARLLEGLLGGASMADIGQALQMSQSMLRKCAVGAAARLGCAGAHQAAARALHMGWLAR